MAKQTVNIGASANDGTGDTIREAFNKVNDNFTEVYDNIDVANSVVTDTSPDLGGDLNVNGFSIVANTGTGIINIVPSTAGYLRLDGIKIDGTVITTHTNNTNITLDPHGTGKVLATKIAFTGGTIDGVTIGATTPVAGTFNVLTVNTALQATGGSIDNILIGSTTPRDGAFLSLDASEINADLINMAGHIIPTTDVTRELGSNAKKWAKLYVDVINANSINLTGTIAGTFSGNVTGNLTGNVTGNVSGNAGTATALQTARNINGVSFNGTSDITVTADANTLSGTTLKSTVVNSSLTSVGTLTGLAIGAGAAINAGNNVIADVATPLSNKDAANKKYVDDSITGLINGAPAALNTLKEIADSLNNDTTIATTIVNGLATKLNLSGGTLTGALLLAADPTSPLQAATKSYVDSSVAATNVISKNNSNVTVTDNNISDGSVRVTVDGNLMLNIGPSNISAESHRIINVTNPSGPQDAATKKYVDDQIGGLAAVASTGQYGSLTGTPTLAIVATSGSYTDLTNAPDLTDFSADIIYAETQIHTAGAMLSDSISVKNYVAIGELSSGALSRLDITDAEADGATIQQVKNNLLDINSQGTLALSSTGNLTIQGLRFPSADGTAGQVLVTNGSGVLSFTGDPTFSTIKVGDGTATNPSIVFATDGGQDSGFFHPGDGIVCVAINTNEKVRVDNGGMRVDGFMKVKGYATGSLPSPAEAGMIVLDTSTNQFKGYNGTSWVVLG